MDNQEQDNKQKELDEASQKTAHVAGKGVATYFGGGVGGKVYDTVSNTKVGQAIENTAGKALQQNPVTNKAMQGLNKSGALDIADKGLDVVGGMDGGLSEKGLPVSGMSGELPNESLPSGGEKSLENNLDSSNMDTGSGNVASGLGSSSFESQNFLQKHKWKLLIIGSSSFFMILLFVLIIGISFSVGDMITKYFNNTWDKLVDFFTKSQVELEEEYYQELRTTQLNLHSDKFVCIDVNLITAALTVNKSFPESLDDMQESDEVEDYKKMKKYVRLLANMQIKTVKYETKEVNGSQCVGIGVATETDLVRTGDHDSSTAELVASHDAGNFAAFFLKKADEEQNNEYHFYRPQLVYDLDSSGNKKYDANKNPITKCNVDLPKDSYQLDIGNLRTMQESVFYWNLVNSFIPDYYSDYLPSGEPERTKKIKKIAEDIYLLYESMGPNQNCLIANQYAYNCGSVDILKTSLTEEQFVAGINSYDVKNESWSLITDNAAQIYEVSVDNGLNPEVVVTRAILEGFSPRNKCGNINYNIWGWGATNGKECQNGKVWSTWDEALLGFITGFKKSFPTTEVFLNKYAYIGDYWYNPGGSGLGGCYYAKYIYPDNMPDHVKQACAASNEGKCTAKDTSRCVKTTAQDQLAYGLYQAKNMNNLRKKIWNLSDDTCGLYGTKEGNCQLFKQGDPRWANVTLINGTKTIGSAGCAVTSVAMAMTCSGTLKDPTNFSPEVLNSELRKNQSVKQGGLIVWSNPGISGLTNGFHYANSLSNLSGTPSEKVNTLSQLMKENSAVIIHTSSRIISPRAGSHYVVLSGIDGFNVRILDPATGNVGQWSVSDIDQVIVYEW